MRLLFKLVKALLYSACWVFGLCFVIYSAAYQIRPGEQALVGFGGAFVLFLWTWFLDSLFGYNK